MTTVIHGGLPASNDSGSTTPARNVPPASLTRRASPGPVTARVPTGGVGVT